MWAIAPLAPHTAYRGPGGTPTVRRSAAACLGERSRAVAERSGQVDDPDLGRAVFPLDDRDVVAALAP